MLTARTVLIAAASVGVLLLGGYAFWESRRRRKKPAAVPAEPAGVPAIDRSGRSVVEAGSRSAATVRSQIHGTGDAATVPQLPDGAGESQENANVNGTLCVVRGDTNSQDQVSTTVMKTSGAQAQLKAEDPVEAMCTVLEEPIVSSSMQRFSTSPISPMPVNDEMAVVSSVIKECAYSSPSESTGIALSRSFDSCEMLSSPNEWIVVEGANAEAAREEVDNASGGSFVRESDCTVFCQKIPRQGDGYTVTWAGEEQTTCKPSMSASGDKVPPVSVDENPDLTRRLPSTGTDQPVTVAPPESDRARTLQFSPTERTLSDRVMQSCVAVPDRLSTDARLGCAEMITSDSRSVDSLESFVLVASSSLSPDHQRSLTSIEKYAGAGDVESWSDQQGAPGAVGTAAEGPVPSKTDYEMTSFVYAEPSHGHTECRDTNGTPCCNNAVEDNTSVTSGESGRDCDVSATRTRSDKAAASSIAAIVTSASQSHSGTTIDSTDTFVTLSRYDVEGLSDAAAITGADTSAASRSSDTEHSFESVSPPCTSTGMGFSSSSGLGQLSSALSVSTSILEGTDTSLGNTAASAAYVVSTADRSDSTVGSLASNLSGDEDCVVAAGTMSATLNDVGVEVLVVQLNGGDPAEGASIASSGHVDPAAADINSGTADRSDSTVGSLTSNLSGDEDCVMAAGTMSSDVGVEVLAVQLNSGDPAEGASIASSVHVHPAAADINSGTADRSDITVGSSALTLSGDDCVMAAGTTSATSNDVGVEVLVAQLNGGDPAEGASVASSGHVDPTAADMSPSHDVDAGSGNPLSQPDSTVPLDPETNGCRTKQGGTQQVFSFYLPTSMCGLFIGKKGRNVNHLKAKSGAFIHVEALPTARDRHLCVIKGTDEAVSKAVDAIIERFPQLAPDLANDAYVDSVPVVASPVNAIDVSRLQLQLVPRSAVNVILATVAGATRAFVQLPTHPTYQSLESLSATLSDVYSGATAGDVPPPLPEPIAPGALCAVESEGVWYRAVVVQQCEGYGEAGACLQLRYLDYGGYDAVPLARVRQLRPEFLSLPFQAVECTLAHVKARDPTDNLSESNAISVLASFTGGLLECINIGTDGETGLPAVELYGNNNGVAVYINELVSAEFGPHLI